MGLRFGPCGWVVVATALWLPACKSEPDATYSRMREGFAEAEAAIGRGDVKKAADLCLEASALADRLQQEDPEAANKKVAGQRVGKHDVALKTAFAQTLRSNVDTLVDAVAEGQLSAARLLSVLSNCSFSGGLSNELRDRLARAETEADRDTAGGAFAVDCRYEPSSDALCRALIEGLSERCPDLELVDLAHSRAGAGDARGTFTFEGELEDVGSYRHKINADIAAGAATLTLDASGPGLGPLAGERSLSARLPPKRSVRLGTVEEELASHNRELVRRLFKRLPRCP